MMAFRGFGLRRWRSVNNDGVSLEIRINDKRMLEPLPCDHAARPTGNRYP